MNKVNPTTCVATSDLNVNIPDDQGRNIVLYFYPKDDTPGCTIEGNDFTRLNDDFTANNSVIYGVSRDSIASHDKFINKFNYTIDLISDEDESLCKQFDVLKPVSYTHLRAHETVLDLVCRLLLEKKKSISPRVVESKF